MTTAQHTPIFYLPGSNATLIRVRKETPDATGCYFHDVEVTAEMAHAAPETAAERDVLKAELAISRAASNEYLDDCATLKSLNAKLLAALERIMMLQASREHDEIYIQAFGVIVEAKAVQS